MIKKFRDWGKTNYNQLPESRRFSDKMKEAYPEVVVNSQELKNQILKAFGYIYQQEDINLEEFSLLMMIAADPDVIKVKGEKKVEQVKQIPKTAEELISPLRGLPINKKRELLHKIVVENPNQLYDIFSLISFSNMVSPDYGYYMQTWREEDLGYPTTIGNVLKEIDYAADGDGDLNINKRLDLEELLWQVNRSSRLEDYKKSNPENPYYDDMEDRPSKFALL